jgi:hypothetical protein
MERVAVNGFHAAGAPAIADDVGFFEKIGADDAAARAPASCGAEPVVDKNHRRGHLPALLRPVYVGAP